MFSFVDQAWKLVEADRSGAAIGEEKAPQKVERNSSSDKLRRYEEAKEERRRRREQRAKAKAAQQVSFQLLYPACQVQPSFYRSTGQLLHRYSSKTCRSSGRSMYLSRHE